MKAPPSETHAECLSDVGAFFMSPTTLKKISNKKSTLPPKLTKRKDNIKTEDRKV